MSAIPLRRPAAGPNSRDSSGLPDAALLASLTARFASTAADHDRSGAFPAQNFEALQSHGLIGLVWRRRGR
jgi:hypothetical protein